MKMLLLLGVVASPIASLVILALGARLLNAAFTAWAAGLRDGAERVRCVPEDVQ